MIRPDRADASAAARGLPDAASLVRRAGVRLGGGEIASGPVRDVHMMRWLSFAILAGIVLVLQTALAPHLALGGVRPDWMFVLACFYALLGPWPDACIGAWICGLLMDLSSVGPVGLCAFSFGGTAWLIRYVREFFFREHWLAHAFVTLFGAMLVQSVIALFRLATLPKGSVPHPGLWSYAMLTSLYTAFWAPYFHWTLTRLRRVTGLRPAGTVWRATGR